MSNSRYKGSGNKQKYNRDRAPGYFEIRNENIQDGRGYGRGRRLDNGRDRPEDIRSVSRDTDNQHIQMNYNNRPRTKRYMGFKYIESLLENQDLEDILITLTNDKKGFKELLENLQVSNDMIILLVKLLSKICDSNFVESKIRVLQMALDGGFIDNVTKFVSAIAIQTKKDKDNNKYFWNNADEFWNNIIIICRSVQDLIPYSSCEKTLKILKAMQLFMPVIEETHSINISHEIKESVQNLHEVVEKTFQEFEKKRSQKEVIIEPIELEPPDDFREINVYPTVREITLPEYPYLRPNIIQGPYQNVNHYLDVQFRLLREDFVAPLRKGICKYLKNSRERLEDIRIYHNVCFLNEETVSDQNCYRIQYDFSGKKKSFQYENSRKFLFGSLLCFTSDNFKSVIFGKIVQRDVKDLEQGHLIVGFNEDVRIPIDLFKRKYLMVESKVYFEPYYQVLNVLKTIAENNFPMEKYIVRVETETDPPDYLLAINPVFYTIENHTFWPLNWSDKKFYGLNDSQQTAFKAALTKEFAIIQGPPGTGKTFLGLKIAHTLIKNKTSWYRKTPMLVICFTNHALDQFLEGLLEATDRIIRVGGQSKNENLKRFNIRYHKHISNETVIQMKHQVRSHLQEISAINNTLKELDSNETIVHFSVFSEVIAEYKQSWFSKASNDEILKWLLASRGTIEPVQRSYDEFQVEENLNMDTNEENLEEEIYIENNEIFDDAFEDIISTSFEPLISLKILADKIKTLNMSLVYLQADDRIQQRQRMIHEEDIIFDLELLKSDYAYIQKTLKDAANGKFRGVPDYVDLQKPYLMPPKSRWQLYFHWLEQYKLKLIEKRNAINHAFRKDYKFYNEAREIEDTQIMKNALVVGMTTTAAARLKSSLQALRSPVVIVEEAAEVLEAHIISSLTSSCKHLILIGDHKQLKPSTANFTIETKFLLGISLFERMVVNNIQCHTLNVQHRMRPEISSLIRPTIYPVLEDHESVLNRPPIRGVENCVYFIDHQEPEQLCKDSSKKNIHEATFLIKLAKHLVLNGYQPEKITVLAAYLGQMFEMIRERKKYAILQDVKICVLDNYQGEENDIILLSLVRNNNEDKIGFLKIENRVCVALSRARKGLYIMGNMTLLCKNSEVWKNIKTSLENLNALGPYLTLRCQIHTYKLTEVRTAEDFMNIPEGGCNLMCETLINCGHFCKSLCHIEDREHKFYKCLEKCNKVLCDNEEHICQKLCYEECGPCCYPVERSFGCGHTAIIDCHIDPTIYSCSVQVRSILPCGHEVDKPCFRDPETFKCPEPCAVRVEPCGHACTRQCHIRDDPDHLQYRCRKPCTKPKTGCSLPDGEKHICTKFCCQDCEPCEVAVKKFRTVCTHVYTTPCNVDVDKIECTKPCTRMLPCGHKCQNACNIPCGNCKQQVEKTVADCGHKVKTECCKEPDRKLCKGKCPRLLPCGHKCNKRCCEECTTTCKVNVDCSIPSPCGHIIKSINCSLKNSVDQKLLLKHCKEKCNVKLKCGHICFGTCGKCLQGRIHQRCIEKCGNTLICNHECPIPCSQACKPCQKKCNYKCPHNKCSRKCGEECIKCKEPCRRQCEHQRCNKFCGEICNIKPCYEPCKKSLKCGHPCVGFCGDPCPILCRVCDHDDLTEIFLGNEDEEDARYVMLQDCKHIFESGDIETWLESTGEITTKCCPKCKSVITSTERFSEYVKNSMVDIINVKIKSNGTLKENNLRRIEYLNEVEEIQVTSAKLFESTDLHCVIQQLIERLQVSRKKDNKTLRQTVDKIDLDVIYAKMQIINLIITVCGDMDIKSNETLEIQMSFIANVLMRDENHITEQEIEDINLEIERLSRIIQYEKIQKAANFTYAKSKQEVKDKIIYIEKLLFTPKRYDKETDTLLQTQLTDLNKLVASSITITAVEKQQIVAALGLQKGHWFKCPNGHYYVITECGGAMQISTCNECGVKIGGQSHQLLPDQRHAPEMDNSSYPAWSEAANLANYRF